MPTPEKPDSLPTRDYAASPPTDLSTAVEGAASATEGPPVGGLLAGRYEVLEEIAQGGMGTVVRCRDHDLQRDLALKVLQLRLAGRPDGVRRFLAEARLTGQLQHPGIVPIHEQGVLPDGRPFFAMKLVRGETLAHLLKARPDPSHDRPRFLAAFLQVCQAVAFAHSRGVIHRDLKPANVMVGAFGEVQVMDWGLAKELASRDAEPGEPAAEGPGPDGTQSGAILGTPAYMSPEQARGDIDRIDRRSDVFSLGAILCEILTGGRPYVATGTDALLAQARDGDLAEGFARLDASGADVDLVALAKRCLAADPAGRPADAGAVAAAASAYLAGVDERARRAERDRAAAEARADEAKATAAAERRLTRGLATAGLLLVAVGAAVVWAVQRQHADAEARRLAADEKAQALMRQADDGLRVGVAANDVARLEQAVADAGQAADFAAQAGPAVRDAADALAARARDAVARARKNRALVEAILDATRPREEESSPARSRSAQPAEPSLDDQFGAAFRRWGIDVDADAPEAALARLRDLADPVRDEVIAGLDEWALERRKTGGPAGWRRVHDLAVRLDDNAARREVRALRLGGRVAASRARLEELADRVDPGREPALAVVTLARALDVAGAADRAEELLVAADAARPGQVVLLDARGKLLQRQGPARLAEAIACYQAARAVRPDLGLALGQALLAARREREAEAVLREVARRRPDDAMVPFRLAEALFARGKLAESEAAYRAALALRPDFVAAVTNLGNVLAERGRPDEAIAAYRDALALSPADAHAHYNLGLVHLEQNRRPEAVASFRQATFHRPDFAEALSNLAAVLYEDEPDEALAACCRAIHLRPDFAEAHNNLGVILSRQGNHAAAVLALRRAVALKPDYLDAHRTLGKAAYHANDPAAAEAAFRKVLDLAPDDAEVHNALGVVLHQLKRDDEGLAAIRRSIELKPDSPEGQMHLGNALHRRGDLDDAVAAYRRGLALRPNDPEALYNLGLTLRDQKKLADAAAAFQQAADLRPAHAAASFHHGRALRDLRRPAEAAVAYRRAIAHRDDYLEAYCDLAVVLHQLRQLDDAIAAGRRAVELRPDLPEPHVNLGVALADRGRLDDAEAAFRRALDLRPENAAAHNNLGMVLRFQKKYDAAAAAFRRAIALKGGEPGPHLNLGLALREGKKLDDAVAAFEKAAELAPGNATVRTQLEQTRRWAALDRRLPEVLAGRDKPADGADWERLGEFCVLYKGHYRTAARFYGEAVAADPSLADKPVAAAGNGVRYSAACLAIIAATGRGGDAADLDDAERARLRRQAQDWLRADLALLEKRLDDADARPKAATRLKRWTQEVDLAVVRDADALDKLPEDERAAWRKLWDDVATVVKKAEMK